MVRHNVHLLVTPRVVVSYLFFFKGMPSESQILINAYEILCFFIFHQEEARKHFNCPILEGMELENQGGAGTEFNHWEKRLLEVLKPNPLMKMDGFNHTIVNIVLINSFISTCFI